MLSCFHTSDVFDLIEALLHKSVLLPGYNVFCVDRSSSGGGAALYVFQTLSLNNFEL